MRLAQLKWVLLIAAAGLLATGWQLLPEPSPYVGNPNAGPSCVYTNECPQFFRFFTTTNLTFAASMVTAVITVWAFIIDRRVKLKTEYRDGQRFAWEQEERSNKNADENSNKGADSIPH